MEYKKSTLKYLLFLVLSVFFFSLAANGQTKKLVVIDPLVAGETVGIESLPPSLVVLRLSETGNPLPLITAELKKQVYNELHIYVLTKPGSIIFDELNLLADNVDSYAAAFGEWKTLLSSEARIVIHSEVLTTVREGEELLNLLMRYTGKVVVANK